MDRGPTLSLGIMKGVANSEVVGPAEEGLTQAESIDESDGDPQADIPFGPGPRVDRTG
jgi:hypothetical protein